MLIDSSGYHIQEVYNNEILTFEVPFLTLQAFFKKILTKREEAIFNNSYNTVKDYWVIKTDIQKIKSQFCLDLYQIYIYVYEKMIQTAALSVNQFFKILFQENTEIKTEKVVDFLKNQLKLPFPKQSITNMVNLFYKNEEKRKDIVKLRDISHVYWELVEVMLPFYNYIKIGLNASIELENSHNISLERIYNHYSHRVGEIEEGGNEVWGIGRMGFYNIAKDALWKLNDLKLEVIFNEKVKKIKKKYLDIKAFVELVKEENIIKDVNIFDRKTTVDFPQLAIKEKSNILEGEFKKIYKLWVNYF